MITARGRGGDAGGPHAGFDLDPLHLDHLAIQLVVPQLVILQQPLQHVPKAFPPRRSPPSLFRIGEKSLDERVPEEEGGFADEEKDESPRNGVGDRGEEEGGEDREEEEAPREAFVPPSEVGDERPEDVGHVGDATHHDLNVLLQHDDHSGGRSVFLCPG